MTGGRIQPDGGVPPGAIRALGGRRERKAKLSTAIAAVLGPDAPLVLLDDAARDCQPESDLTWLARHCAGLRKAIEDRRERVFGNTGAAIRDVELRSLGRW